ncbi:fungal-specific transcription factor domain-containing protein [Phaeosphaeriaceae sp. PMI808]|nr:fungal-specific transcription factor domain-containing protein [Phaeosphaeriaceae sp. PMI808]
MEHRRSAGRNSLTCDRCRHKKLKCSKETPTCSACAHSKSPCHYSGKIIRSPLTRAYLSSVEKRLASIENLVSRLVPDVDIDSLLSSPDFAKVALPVASSSSSEVLHTKSSSPSNTIGPEREPIIHEAVPQSADGFNWQEENVSVDGLTDGMAALSVEPTGVGYLGSTSGVVFLRCLLDWARFLHQSRAEGQIRQAGTSAAFEDVLASSQISYAALSQQLSSTLVDAYFHDYHVCYPFVHEATFRAQYHEIVPRPPQRSWDMLYHAILALGAWTLNQDQVGLEDYLYRRALTLGQHESVFEAANLTTVQALVLLSNLSQKRNSPNTGWNLLGLAVRTALSLALHRELPHWNISLLDREIRRRVWWGLFIFDSGASTTFGRAIMLPDNDAMNVHSVLNINGESLTPRTIDLPVESNEFTLHSSLKTQSDFHLQTNQISNRLLADPGLSAEAALSQGNVLDTWCRTLPPYFQVNAQVSSQYRWHRFARSRLWWRFWNFKIIVFRHILLRRAIASRKQTLGLIAEPDEEQCKHICIEAAHSTIISIREYCTKTLSRLEGWYATYFLFHSALIMSLCFIGFPLAEETQQWHEDICLARNVFRDNLGKDSLSARCVAILDQVVADDSTDHGLFQDVQLDDGVLSAFPWSIETNELFDSFDWNLNSNTF